MLVGRRRGSGRCCPTAAPPPAWRRPTCRRCAGVDHLHLSGYVLGDPGSRAAGLAALAAARAAGASTSVDPQVTGLLSPALLRGLGRIDLLLPAAAELAALTG